jgi:hypothetical protein
MLFRARYKVDDILKKDAHVLLRAVVNGTLQVFELPMSAMRVE